MLHLLNHNLSKQRGFILLELLALVAGIILATSFVFVQNERLWRQYHKGQVRLSALLLASDLRQLQQQALFQTDASSHDLKPTADRAGYYLTTKGVATSSVRFADYACQGVYFDAVLARMAFSQNGAPSTSGYYRLRHKDVAGFAYLVDVQPVTGRVVAYEGQ